MAEETKPFKILLTPQDGDAIAVSSDIAEMSVLLKNLMDVMRDMDQEVTEIPVPNVTHDIMAKVIEYLEHHKDDPPLPPDDGSETSPYRNKNAYDIDEWDASFCKLDQATVFDLILAANYLDIKPLLDLTCKTVANMIRGKTPDEIRKIFNIENDFTPEEEEQIKRENEWATEKNE